MSVMEVVATRRRCLICGRPGGQHSITRGLCSTHYTIAKRTGTISDFPRLTMSRDDLLNEWEFFRQSGSTVRDLAESLGKSFDGVMRALYRARDAGDPRAAGFVQYELPR